MQSIVHLAFVAIDTHRSTPALLCGPCGRLIAVQIVAGVVIDNRPLQFAP